MRQFPFVNVAKDDGMKNKREEEIQQIPDSLLIISYYLRS